ncbi:amidohydrolase family protein [Subsaximicrobium wynnwilliamsii]|uniref:Amidohydrolase family protein n=1 Tax=Subsaximicrobium wynnwilliamsii TaxID=291179 RepID=A0A5C6ZK00_9FLAO|nr:amidohydrolase family protein [Subsaximicrobium wynnwilliamsii]TXD84863.1 amidohydrolase family protein [Subsaximicrobium wynnwilliamsii]TXD90534.1 amidohydrolase family protein [Subsaximicrobium wynnwilliamsii]TXE05009.1 amidohydrolase family protein [Subsaximicrobium wynnwilliamsii]
MKTFYKLTLLALIFNFQLGSAQQTPAAKQSQPIAITGATAHIGDGTIIENSILVFKDGKLTTVADSAMTKIDLSGMEVIDASGKHVYPGFIAPNSTLGLVEIDAVRATDDDSELGSWNPHIRSLIAYNAESKIVESMRPNGVLIGQITPRGGRISGTSSVVQFDAWNWEDAAIKVDDGIHMSWPNSFSRGRWWLGEDPAMKVNEDYDKQVTEIQSYFNASKAYENGDTKTINLPYAAVAGLFDGSKTLYIEVNDEKGITDAIHFANSENVKAMVIVGGYEAYKVADLLAKNNIPVLLNRVHSRPNAADDDYDLPFKLAKLLTDKGVMVALQADGQMERMNTRNLPFYAGTTVAYGLTKAQALQLITLNPAKILGIDKDYGSLEVGKSATLFISEGDALDMRTNILSRAFIDGRDLSLETHQTELWKRYSKKYSAKK